MEKNTLFIGTGMLALGVAIGWSVKPDAPVREVTIAETSTVAGVAVPSAAPAQVAASETPPPGKRALREPSAKKTDPGPTKEVSKQAARMQGEMTKLMTSRQRSKMEKYIQRISDNVDLTETQSATLKTWLDERMEKLAELDFTNPESVKGMTDLMESLTDKTVDEQLADSFTEEQKQSFSAFKEKEIQSKVDAAALKSLSQLQGVVDFEEGQRDEVYKILAASAEERVRQEQERPDPAAMFTEGMGIDMDPYGLGLQDAMTEVMKDRGMSGDLGNPQSAAQAMRTVVDKRIEERVEQLRPVLNEKQLEQYRTELKTKGLGVYGTALNSMAGGEPELEGLDIEVPVQ